MPDGLFGLLTTMARVRGVTAASTCSRAGTRLPGSGATTTGTARHIFTISGYDTQYGASRITSSPASRMANSALKIACLAPEVTMMWRGATVRP